jgi:hypothetical protein
MVLVEGAGTPLGLHVAAASPAEVTLLDATLATIHVPRAPRAGRPRQRPNRLIADRGSESNAVRTALDTRGIYPPHSCPLAQPSGYPSGWTLLASLSQAVACGALQRVAV